MYEGRDTTELVESCYILTRNSSSMDRPRVFDPTTHLVNAIPLSYDLLIVQLRCIGTNHLVDTRTVGDRSTLAINYIVGCQYKRLTKKCAVQIKILFYQCHHS